MALYPMTFGFSVASGDLTNTSAVLWTRITGAMDLRWELESLDGTTSRRGDCRATSEGFVHVHLSGLKPGARWRYRFAIGSTFSRWGHFRTLPESGPVRFAVVSCARYISGFFNAYETLAERDDLDFVLHLGDYIYEAGQIPRGNQAPGIDVGRLLDPTHDCVTSQDYGRRYEHYRRDPQLQALHEAHGMIFTLDDHEIADNAWAGGAEHHYSSDGPWELRLKNALTAWENWQPTARTPSSGGALWQVLRLGEVATLFLCDSRLNRTDPFAPDGPAKSLLGHRQADVLAETVQRDREPWFILGMPSKFLSLESARGDEDTALVLRTLKLSDPEGAPYHDRWDSYAYERDRLMTILHDAPRRTIVLCGDVHFAAFSRTSPSGIAECVTTSITSPNFDDKMGWTHGGASRPYETKLVARVPELEWCDLDRHGFLIVEASAERFTCEWWGVLTLRAVSPDAEVLHRITLAAGGDAGD